MTNMHVLSRRDILLSGAAQLALSGASLAAPPIRSAVEPRRVLALYDGAIEQTLKETSVHTRLAMPLEWLGLTLDYRDVRDQLPPLWDDPECRGVVTWFPEPNLQQFAAYTAWLERVAASGRRVVQIGDAAPKPGLMSADEEARLRRRCFRTLGLSARGQWSAVTLGDRIASAKPGGVGFEQAFDGGLPPYELYMPDGHDLDSWLVVERADRERSKSHVVVASKAGGFVAPGYAVGVDPRTSVKRWSIDPFAFFAAAFAVEDMPAPDTTTVCGRRIYYSHIDGDGWRSLSQVRQLGKAPPTCAEIILDEVIAANPDLPVTVAPIAAEMDPAFAGDLRAITAARRAFNLPHVEAATHTYTHPFRWAFFEHYSPEAERPFQAAYDNIAAGRSLSTEAALEPVTTSCCARARTSPVSPPRAFGGHGFSLDQEVAGSARLIQSIAPAGKEVRLLQWPGDCAPFAAALDKVATSGLLNINGGDTRCDDDFPSVSAVAAIGFRRGGAIQIYASNSSEELYTELWSDHFYGFRDLVQTWARTESPRRLKPLNLYYHMYSGERRASLEALQQNIAVLRQTGDYIGMFASRFAEIAHGFFTTELVREGLAWRVLERGGLQTLRFADGNKRMLDLNRSQGVLGERHIGDMLYVALDPAESTPLVALTERTSAPVTHAMLVESSWEISRLKLEGNTFSFRAKGFGIGHMQWRVPLGGSWTARVGDDAPTGVRLAGDRLDLSLAQTAEDGVTVALTQSA